MATPALVLIGVDLLLDDLLIGIAMTVDTSSVFPRCGSAGFAGARIRPMT